MVRGAIVEPRRKDRLFLCASTWTPHRQLCIVLCCPYLQMPSSSTRAAVRACCQRTEAVCRGALNAGVCDANAAGTVASTSSASSRSACSAAATRTSRSACPSSWAWTRTWCTPPSSSPGPPANAGACAKPSCGTCAAFPLNHFCIFKPQPLRHLLRMRHVTCALS